MFKHSLSGSLELALHAEFSSPGLSFTAFSLHNCSLSCCVAFFSLAYVQSCYVTSLYLFLLSFIYYSLSVEAFLFFVLYSLHIPLRFFRLDYHEDPL